MSTPPAAPSDEEIAKRLPTMLRLARSVGTVGYQQFYLIAEVIDAIGMLESLLAANARLKVALGIALEFINDRVDVDDGDYGQPKPNVYMQLSMQIDAALSRHNEAGK